MVWFWGGICLLLVVCAWPALGGGWVHDDGYVATHAMFDDASDVMASFVRVSHDYAENPLSRGSGFTYRPLATASLVATNVVLGRDPVGHHVLSLMLHLLACGVMLCLLMDARRRWLAPLAAGLAVCFALHPVLGETYLWISGRTDQLATLALLGAALLLRAREQRLPWTDSKPRVFAALSCLLILGALSKEPFLVAALSLVLAHALHGAGRASPDIASAPPQRPWPAAAAFVLSVVVWLGLRSVASADVPAVDGGVGSPFLDPSFIRRLPRLMAIGVESLVAPAPRPMRALGWELDQSWTAVHGALLAAAIAALAWLLARRCFREAVLLVGAGATLAPTAVVAEHTWLGLDRYLAMPLVLVLTAAAPWVATPAARTGTRRAVGAGAALLCTSWLAWSVNTTATYYSGQEAFLASMMRERPQDPSGFLTAISSEHVQGADARDYAASLAARDLTPAFAHRAATLQLLLGLHEAVEQTLERAHERYPQEMAFDLLELRGVQRRFPEALKLARELLQDGRRRAKTCAKLREWLRHGDPPAEAEQEIHRLLSSQSCPGLAEPPPSASGRQQ